MLEFSVICRTRTGSARPVPEGVFRMITDCLLCYLQLCSTTTRPDRRALVIEQKNTHACG